MVVLPKGTYWNPLIAEMEKLTVEVSVSSNLKNRLRWLSVCVVAFCPANQPALLDT